MAELRYWVVTVLVLLALVPLMVRVIRAAKKNGTLPALWSRYP